MGMVKIRAEYHDPFPGLHNDQSTSALGRRRGLGHHRDDVNVLSYGPTDRAS